MKKIQLVTLLSTALCLSASQAAERDYINIVGSDTVYPFATVVAEHVGKMQGFKTPKIEHNGSGAGFKMFCAGVGADTPDFSNASRRMKQSEFDTCHKNGVEKITEIVIGYDGIVLANKKDAPVFNLTERQIFLALAKEVPSKEDENKFIPNPYKTWKDIDPKLPNEKIEVMGPPPTSGTRDAFSELIMDEGCKTFPSIAAIKKTDKKKFKAMCQGLREDGGYVETDGNYNLIVQKLETSPSSLGIFGYNYLDQNSDKIKAAKINGEVATVETIADHKYPVARPLFFYVKGEHIGKIPGMRNYIKTFVSEEAFGDDGYLVDKGLIPLPAKKREMMRKDATSLKVMTGLTPLQY